MILARSQQHVSRSICLVLFCEVVTALPATSFVSSLKGFLPAEGGSAVLASSFHCDPSGLQNVNPTGFVAYFFVGVGLLCIIIGLKMPKSVREKRLDREYKSSLKDLNRLRPRNGQEKVRTEENQIHRLCNESNSRKERYGEPETISNEGTGPGKEGLQVAVNRSFTFPARTRSHHPRLPRLTLAKTTRHGPGPLNSRESHNFGENPNYHDDGFQYSPAHEGRSVSTPPSPFSSRFYASNIKKVQSHKRTQSSPSAYQTFQVSMGIQNNAGSRSHFPLPTLRPVTPPEVMSTPGSPLSDSRFEEPVNNVRGYRYLRQYPQIPQSHQNTRAQSVPLPEASLTAISTPSPNTTPHFVPERQTEIVEASAHQRATEFQPVMIFEQGQSITGHKWRRKVTVFRSEILERLEKEGLVIC